MTVEVWPGGLERRKKLLARGIIKNDTSGTVEIGNYDVELRGGSIRKMRGRVYGWRRLEQNVWWLVADALRSALDSLHRSDAPIPEAVMTSESADA